MRKMARRTYCRNVKCWRTLFCRRITFVSGAGDIYFGCDVVKAFYIVLQQSREAESLKKCLIIVITIFITENALYARAFM